MQSLNLGILAHVDAGKTSLTERLLFAAGVIDKIGRVDDGSTQTDSLALERQRGITIKAAVVSFAIGDLVVNLIDTPGHPDFIAEVERTLGVLDGAVLVVSAVEGVQAQTRILMRTLRRLHLPAVVFVNKIDRSGASPDRVLAEIAARLTPAVTAMGAVTDPGTRGASFLPFGPSDAAHVASLADVLTRRDDDLLAAYVEDQQALPYPRLRAELAAQTRRALVYPAYFGSAVTGSGVDALMAGLAEFLPAAAGDAAAPAAGTVFKVERELSGEKVAYVRMFAGTVRAREQVPYGNGADGKITALSVLSGGPPVPSAAVTAGQIARVCGLADVQIGDTIGPAAVAARQHLFAPPTLETLVVPATAADRPALYAALTQLAEQDPLINLRLDDIRRELQVSLYGEVQKEVIQATLATEFGLQVAFRESTTICIERVLSSGAAVERMDRGGNPFRATVGLRIEPGPAGGWHVVPAGGRAGLDAARVHQGSRGDGPRDAAARPARLGGHRLRGDADSYRFRPTAALRLEQVVELSRRLPESDAAGADERAAASQDGGLRACQRVPPRGPGRLPAASADHPRPAARRPADTGRRG